MQEHIRRFQHQASVDPALAACARYVLGKAGLLPGGSQARCAEDFGVTREALRAGLPRVRRLAARVFGAEIPESTPSGALGPALEKGGHSRPRRASGRGGSSGRTSRRTPRR
jgi:hypothetical protein